MSTNEAITIERPETEEQEAANQAIVVEAKGIAVSSADEHGAALEFLKRVAGMAKNVRDLFEAPKRAAHAAHKEICGAEKKLLGPIEAASQHVRGKVLAYEREEKRRAEAEARRKAEEARKAEEERRLADAEQAEEEGDHETADAILDEEPAVPISVAPTPKVAKVEGVQRRTRYVAEVVDLHALVKFVAENPEWLHLLKPDTAALNAIARTQKDRARIGGVVVRAEQSLAVGSR